MHFGDLLDKVKWLNCGGGHLMTHAEYDCDELIAVIREFKERHPHLRIILEPGSAFTWRTGCLVATVEEHYDELIEGIENACHHYRADRINPTDKSILLIAMAEIKYFDDIPPVVSVSEAAGLARKYSTDTSADFVNGVLAGVIN
jgi:transcription termination factor NusB